MSSPTFALAVRGSTGVHLNYGPPAYETVPQFVRDTSKACRTMLFSPQGDYFAWVNGTSLKIVMCKNWSLVAEIPGPKVCCLDFSPCGTYLSSWEPFSVSNANPQGSPNLHIYRSENGELVKEFLQKKQTEWQLKWSSDEALCARKVNNDVVFYENANFDCIVNRISCSKVGSFSLACSPSPYFVVCSMPGKPGQPSFGRMFQYPKFEIAQAVGSKTFFQVDKVEFFWNAKCNSVLLMTSTEVDKKSYYGKQTLHYMNTKGDTALVILSKEGPIYSVEWSPKSTEFCIVYGFMPAKATLFNLKCEPVFELGTGPQNSIYFNRHGNILLLGGFGNLRGQITLWDLTKLKKIGQCEAADTTQLEWAPDGVHFATATTAPRLRMGNGFKIWHYTGTLLYERPWNKQEELYEICWQKYPNDVFKENSISYKPVEGIRPSAPQASKQAYRPPSARGRETNFKLHDEEDTPPRPGESASKAAIKQRKRREAQKARKQVNDGNSPTHAPSVNINNGDKQETKPSSAISLTGDPEKDKKIRNIKKKLDAITKLKEEQASGKTLQINQLSKIKTETDLINELKELTL